MLQIENIGQMTKSKSPADESLTKIRFYKRWYFIVPVILVTVLIGLWVASELIILRVAESYAKREIKKKYPEVKNLSVSIKAFP